MKLHEEGLEIRRVIHGSDKANCSIAYSLYALGHVYYYQENYDEAAKFYEQSFDMFRTLHGTNTMHHDIALVLSSLGAVYREQGKVEKA